jgi:hypothetical protein
VWRDHFGEETFWDIWVYVQYGGRTPSEALGILGLEPPPEKRIEPKQEGSKPSEKKIKVTTPEISTNKEVKKMEEEKKVNFFPFSDAQQAERSGGDFFPSFSGEGFEEVVLDREDIYNDKGKGAHPGFHRLQLRELPKFLLDEFSAVAVRGGLPATYNHFINEIEKVKGVDAKVVRAFRKYASEVEKARTRDQQLEVLKPIVDYLGAMRREKI